MKTQIDTIISAIRKDDPRYHEDAYTFVLEAISFTQKKNRRLKHVSGQELLEGIKVLLMQQFGPMAMSVLRHWGIRSTEDFGQIVFKLVDNKLLSKNEEDRLEDFKDGYDFEKVFQEGYRSKMHKDISRLR